MYFVKDVDFKSLLHRLSDGFTLQLSALITSSFDNTMRCSCT